MRIAGGTALAIGLLSAAAVLVALLTGLGGTVGGYVCFGIVAVVFVGAGVSMLAGSRAMPDGWPPRDDDED